MKCSVDVENVPKRCEDKYIVARLSCLDDGLWFWGSFNDFKEAKERASAVEGVVCLNMEANNDK